MKASRIHRYIWLIFLLAGWITAKGQYQQEVPGDNFSLEGALELFKESESPEDFEKKLNHQDARVNNLDLNGDGYIDYIRVIDMYEGNVHAFVLQAVISKREFQDVAVITLEKQANGHAVLQITGDADIYGVETIIEPTTEVRTYAGTTSSRAIVNVWSWPMVRYVYSPYYAVWVSPWEWRYRPHWWRPWRPVYYYDYYSYWRPYRRHYSLCHTHRVVYAHHIYAPHRTTSVIVHKQHNHTIVNYRTKYIDNDGHYRRSANNSYYRPTSATVRYDSNGRIRSNASKTEKERTYTSSRNQSRTSGDYQRGSGRENTYRTSGRSSNSDQYRTNRGQERSSGNRNENSYKTNPRDERGYSTGNERQLSDRPGNSGNSVNKSNGRSYDRSSGNSQRSSSTPQVQRSNERSNSSTIHRSPESTNTQKYSGRSSNAQRSSGNSNVQRSSGNSSTKSYSGRSSNVQRSSGNSSVQRPSRSSSSNKSTGSSNVQRSNSSSNSQKSSGSSSSSSGRSGSSKGKSRNRN